MIATASAEMADEARIYRDQGKGAFTANHHTRLGYAWRLSEQNAATGLVHMRRLTEFIKRRREVAARYDKALASLDGLEPLTEPAECKGNIYKYIVLLPEGADRAWFKQTMAEQARRAAGRRGVRHPAAPPARAGLLRRGGAAAGRRSYVQPARLPARPFRYA